MTERGLSSQQSLVFKFRQAGDHVVEVATVDFAELVVAGQEQLDPDAALMAERDRGVFVPRSWCLVV